MKNVRDYNVGKSDYAKHTIQPWDIILEYGLNYWDGDIIKRVLRTKEGEPRRLDYEKIIHICNERIRQIDVSEGKKEESDDVDGTTVFCLSEAHKPAYSANGPFFRVHSVFKNGKHWYAYVGYSELHRAHIYISLTCDKLHLSAFNNFPLPVVLLSNSLAGVEHTASVKIGALGTDYKKYDYLINGDKLYRFMGLSDNGKLFKYAKFMGGDDIDFIEVSSLLRNYAKQVASCEK